MRPDGNIVAAGQAPSLSWDFAVADYNADGSVDSSIRQRRKATDGLRSRGNNNQTCTVVETPPRPCRDDQAFAVAADTNGALVAAGVSRGSNEGDFALARYTVR